MRTIAITLAAAAFAVPVIGQGAVTPQATLTQGVPLERQFVEARAAVESRITTGAPYLGDALTESMQVLSDGNRIARKSSTRIYRDSEGRSRREQLSPTGEVQSISISDPVAGATYFLNPATKTAQRANVFMATGAGQRGSAPTTVAAGGGGGAVTVARGGGRGGVATADEGARKREVETQAAVAVGRSGSGEPPTNVATIVYPAEAAVSLPRAVAPSGGVTSVNVVNKEDLGTQIVEGVAATGTRTTTMIPAGAIGNDKPIEIVSEQWFSPDLKVLVMTKHSDPRSGETTYRLTNIAQTEPSRSLFEVPADYTIKEGAIRRQSPMHD